MCDQQIKLIVPVLSSISGKFILFMHLKPSSRTLYQALDHSVYQVFDFVILRYSAIKMLLLEARLGSDINIDPLIKQEHLYFLTLVKIVLQTDIINILFKISPRLYSK